MFSHFRIMIVRIFLALRDVLHMEHAVEVKGICARSTPRQGDSDVRVSRLGLSPLLAFIFI